jgi:hypothetical protein
MEGKIGYSIVIKGGTYQKRKQNKWWVLVLEHRVSLAHKKGEVRTNSKT